MQTAKITEPIFLFQSSFCSIYKNSLYTCQIFQLQNATK